MQNRTRRDSASGRDAKRATLTAADVFGMFEAGLQELSMHFQFTATNVAGGVQLVIERLERVDHEDGTWSLRMRERGMQRSGVTG